MACRVFRRRRPVGVQVPVALVRRGLSGLSGGCRQRSEESLAARRLGLRGSSPRSRGFRNTWCTSNVPSWFESFGTFGPRCGFLPFKEARLLLEKEISESSPRSLAALADELGVCRPVLSGRFPELAAKVTGARRLARLRPAGESGSETQARYRDVLRAELASSQPRSVAEIARSLGTGRPDLVRADREAVERLVAARQAIVRRERSRLVARVVQALQSELSAEVPRPVTQVARDLGVSRQQLARIAPDLVRRVVGRRVGRALGGPDAYAGAADTD